MRTLAQLPPRIGPFYRSLSQMPNYQQTLLYALHQAIIGLARCTEKVIKGNTHMLKYVIRVT